MKILLVNDSPGLRRRFAPGLRVHLNAQVEAVTNAQEAIIALETQKADVVVVNLSMSVMDGFSLLAYLNRKQVTVPVIVLSSLGVQERALAQCAAPIPESSVHYQRLSAQIEALVQSEQVRRFSLAELLSLLEAERKSCALLVKSGRRKGRLHFLFGKLVNAFSFEQEGEGEEAALDILSWGEVSVEVERSYHNYKRLIKKSPDVLLKEIRSREEAAYVQSRGSAEGADASSVEIKKVAKEALSTLDKLLSEPAVQQAKEMLTQDIVGAQAQPDEELQSAVHALLERVCHAEEAFSDVMQAVAVFLEKQKSLKQQAPKVAVKVTNTSYDPPALPPGSLQGSLQPGSVSALIK